jgi:predicted amidophosphoribosyltransferase
VATLRPPPDVVPPPGIDWWRAPFRYEGVAREIVARAKYRDERRLLHWLAVEMVRVSPLGVNPDIVTFAPASSSRLLAHGIDHGQVLARDIATRLHCACGPLFIRAPGASQTGAAREDRARGPEVRALQSVRGMNVLVVDDVATTGATLIAIANALRGAGASSIGVLTAARTPRRVLHHR